MLNTSAHKYKFFHFLWVHAFFVKRDYKRKDAGEFSNIFSFAGVV